MTRRLMIALLAIVMSAHVTGCTSGGSSGDSEVAESNDETFAEEGAGDFAEEAPPADETAPPSDTAGDLADPGADAGNPVAENAPPDAAADELSLDGDPAAPPADVAATDPAKDPAADSTVAPDGDLSLDDSATLPEEVAKNDQPENITETPSAPSDAGVFNDPSQKEQAAVAPEPAPLADNAGFSDAAPSARASGSAPATSSPYLKVKEAAFTAADGTTLNRVYLARPKDNAKSIATKLYGDASRSKALAKWNPVMKRGVRAGDKIYYASSANPTDSVMKTYYEEAGIPAQTYVAKDHDNFRDTAKTLLGFKDAWKEVYATNPGLSEKSGRIPTGLELRYWSETGGTGPAVTTAQNAPPPTSPDTSGLPTTLPDQAPNAAPPAGTAAAAGTMAPPADPFQPENTAANAQGAPPSGPDPLAPPPPMPEDAAAGAMAKTGGADPLAPPPVPPPGEPKAAPGAKQAKHAPAAEPEAAMDADTTMALGVGAVLLLAAAALFVMIRKNRAKRMDLGQTQV